MTQQRYTLDDQTFYLVPPQGGQWVMDGENRRVFSGTAVIDENGYVKDTEGNFLFSEETNGYLTADEANLEPVVEDKETPAETETPAEQDTSTKQETVEPETETEAPTATDDNAEQTTVASESTPANETPDSSASVDSEQTTEPSDRQVTAPITQTAVAPPVVAPPVPVTTVVPPVVTTPEAAPTFAAPAYANQPPVPLQTGAIVPNKANNAEAQNQKAEGIKLSIAIPIIALAAIAGVGVSWLIFHLIGS